MSTLEQSTSAATSLTAAYPDRTSSQLAKQPRVLACLLCQQRKVRCDRKFPCANCTRSHAQCVPAATQNPRQRRRRFPERELLDRLRHYESLLRQNNIEFAPLHRAIPTTEAGPVETYDNSNGHDPRENETSVPASSASQASSPSTKVKSETVYEAKSFWDAMNQRTQSTYSNDDSDDSSAEGIPEAVVKDEWNEVYRHSNNDHLLFGSRDTSIEISTLHPEQVQIFRLWQVYLDNVNPLLKITHTPTLQARIIDAAGNVATIKSTLAALMLSIYCVAILTLSEEECLTMFSSPRESLLKKYQLGCQQALMACGFLRSPDRDCLTALYLYLISVKPSADPQSLSSMIAVAIRLAQRMGIHTESSYTKHPALEAEMRRRLWWSLVLFDNRLCEMSDYRTTSMIPTWDCKTPLNLDDFDLQPEMKDLPAVQERSSEALFAVMRSELGDVIRHSVFHLDFVNPALKALAKGVLDGSTFRSSELAALEKRVESIHLKYCSLQNPLHLMTIWMARGQFAKCRLMEHYTRFPTSSVAQTDAQRNAAVSNAQRMLECDTQLITSSSTKGYRWFIDLYFPFPGYIHLVQDLRMRPTSDHAIRNWKVITENYEARIEFREQRESPLYRAFTKIILQAWRAREVLFAKSGTTLIPPRIVLEMQERAAPKLQEAQETGGKKVTDDFSMGTNFLIPLPVDAENCDVLHDMGRSDYTDLESQSMPYQNLPIQAGLEGDWNDMNWTPTDWNPFYPGDWGIYQT